MTFYFVGQQFSTGGLFGKAGVPITPEAERDFVALAEKLNDEALAVVDEEGGATLPVCSNRPFSGLIKGKDDFVKVLQQLTSLTGWTAQFLPGAGEFAKYYFVRLSSF